MTTSYSAGVQVGHEDGLVKLRIVEIDDAGELVRVMAGIGIHPVVARNIAFELTTESYKVEDGA